MEEKKILTLAIVTVILAKTVDCLYKMSSRFLTLSPLETLSIAGRHGLIYGNNNEPIENIGVKPLRCSESSINLLHLGVNVAINHRDASKKVYYIKIDRELTLKAL